MKLYSPVVAFFLMVQLISCKKEDECIPPSLEVSVSPVVFAGQPIEFTVVADDEATFYWTGPNGFTSTDQNPVIPDAQLEATGEYTVVAKRGACETSDQVSLEVINPAPCSPANNTISFVSTMTFSHPLFGKNSVGRYELSGTGIQGDFRMEFYNDPVLEGSAVYRFSPGNSNPNNVFMQMDIPGGVNNWQAMEGDLYVEIINNTPVFTFCNVLFGNLQSSATKKASGKITP